MPFLGSFASRTFARTPNPLLSNSDLNMSLARCHRVPGLSAEEVAAASEEAFKRHSSPSLKRNGAGVAIMWFRNDLRVLDNEALIRAWAASDSVLPVYCVDPRHFGTTHYFGFPKTGAFRAQFLMESLADLKKNLMKQGLDLLVRHGKPEDILPSVAKAFGAHTVINLRDKLLSLSLSLCVRVHYLSLFLCECSFVSLISSSIFVWGPSICC